MNAKLTLARPASSRLSPPPRCRPSSRSETLTAVTGLFQRDAAGADDRLGT